MGLFGFIGDIASAGVKIALTPIAVVEDAVSIVTGNEADTTKKLISSAGDDMADSLDDLFE